MLSRKINVRKDLYVGVYLRKLHRVQNDQVVRKWVRQFIRINKHSRAKNRPKKSISSGTKVGQPQIVEQL